MSEFEKVRGVPRASGAARPGEYVQHPTHATLGRIRLPAVGVAASVRSTCAVWSFERPLECTRR